MFCKKDVLRKSAKFTGKHLCRSLFFNEIAGLSLATLLKKRLWHRYFPVNFEKFLRTPFLQNTSGRLLLSMNNCFQRWKLELEPPVQTVRLYFNFKFSFIYLYLFFRSTQSLNFSFQGVVESIW